jgi:hypothetical protein
MIKGIKHMYVVDQSKLRGSKTFSSLHSLQKVFSSNGLVKISASWFSVLIWNTLIVTEEWDFAQIVTKVPEGLPHPK